MKLNKLVEIGDIIESKYTLMKVVDEDSNHWHGSRYEDYIWKETELICIYKNQGNGMYKKITKDDIK